LRGSLIAEGPSVITGIYDWLDRRTGVRKMIAALLLEGIPGGARWRYVWGSCLVFVFSIQLITGILLMTAYSPSSSQAWSSVHFIQYQMDFGWLIRGLHHFGSQTMMVLIALHMLQVVIAGAHLPPREVNWWLGIGLLTLTMGLGLTGYLLPWDQKGYWATRVATNIASNMPVLGDDIKQLAVGGPDYGNHTLTRFYALHVGVFPLAMIVLIAAHIYIFRRQGVTSPANQEGLVARPENEQDAEAFWPRQAFYDLVACMVVFAVMFGLIAYGFGHAIDGVETPSVLDYDHWAKAGQRGKGANLDAPADRDTPDYPARPEWYFLFLFQLLKYFPGEQRLIGTVYIPGGAFLLLILLPIFGYGPLRRFGHFFGMLVIMTLMILVGILTVTALRDDSSEGVLFGLVKPDPETVTQAKHHEDSVKKADELANRACNIAMAGTPVEGAHIAMRNDPKTGGRKLFEMHCGSCHAFNRDTDRWQLKNPTASDLGEFGSAAWVHGLLKNPLDAKHFGNVKIPMKDEDGKIVKDKEGKPKMIPALDGMKEWRDKLDALSDTDRAQREAELAAIAAFVAEQAKARDKRDAKIIDAGQELFFDRKNAERCSGCHRIEKKSKDDAGKITFDIQGSTNAPSLVDYGSAEWIRGMIMNPGHKTRYGKTNLMPAFRDSDAPGSSVLLQDFKENKNNFREEKFNPPPMVELSGIQREVIIRWMLRDDRPVFGGAPIAP
jgi:ubiquinol-cytochrome c reductase cytochrome b subunit